MANGSITEYANKHPGADRLGLVCFIRPARGKPLTCPNQLLDVAKGLNYLHSIRMVHGDLKGVRELPRHYPNPLTDVIAKHSYR